MPRTARASAGDVVYHVINRGNGRARVFHNKADYEAFVLLIGAACDRHRLRVLAYCLMPNHFHLVLWPREDGDLSASMQWLLTSHVRRYHRLRGTSGHVWQGRFKAFPIQHDEYLLAVLRYVERNPVRAGLAERAHDWSWSSAAMWVGERPAWLHLGPVERPAAWLAWVNAAQSDAEVESLRRSVNRGTPWGEKTWAKRIASRLGLESTMRPRGRPPR